MAITNAAEIEMNKSMGTSQMTKLAKVIDTCRYCIKAKNGELNCKFASLSSCQDKANSLACKADPPANTTGSK